MNSAEFDTQFNRLKSHFHAPSAVDEVGIEWFQSLEHYHIDALDRGVTHLIRTSTDRFWPALGTLREAIQTRMAGLAFVHSKCLTCHGNGWIDTAPFFSNGLLYDNAVVRCPDCGKPAPEYQAPSSRRALTAVELAQWRSGELAQPNMMPEGLRAWPESAEERMKRVETTRMALDRLRVKLFGKINSAKAEARQTTE